MLYVLFSIFIIGIGVFMCYARRKRWTDAETYGGVVESFTERPGFQGHTPRRMYCAVVRYEKDGRLCTAQHAFARPREGILHDIGENVMICVSPSAPKEFVYADESKTPALGVLCIAVGAMLLVFNIVINLL